MANSMGDWQADEAAHKLLQSGFTLKQTFQVLSGFLRIEGKTFALEGKVRGEDVRFTAGGREYRDKMHGKRLEPCRS